MLLTIIVALVILPFLLTMAVNMAVQTAKRKARFRLLRRSINHSFPAVIYEPASGEVKACCLPFRKLSWRSGDFLYLKGIAKGKQRRDDRAMRLSYQSRWVHVAPQRKFCCGWH